MRFTMRDSAGYPNATKPAPGAKSMDVEAKSGSDPELDTDFYSDDASSLAKSDLLGKEDTDVCLAAKMRLVNNAIDEIGFTGE